MTVWDTYPVDYRAAEVRAIAGATQAGESASVVGLSGAGKSNLLGFLANRSPGAYVGVRAERCHYVLVDCNRLTEHSPEAFFRLIRRTLGSTAETSDELGMLDTVVERQLFEHGANLGLLFDRFDDVADNASASLFNNLRALRDGHKYRLTLVAATRHALSGHSELAELFYAHTIWLGPLTPSDARWTVARYCERKGLQQWDEPIVQALVAATRGYPSLLRAACEAYADGATPDAGSLAAHPAVKARVEEFWSDNPTDEEVRRSGLQGPLLMADRPAVFDTAHLTAKEHLLLNYFQAHPGAVSEKDDLIRAVWPEDQILQRGLRDDSLAQLVRRLREKIEPDPANPRHIHTVPGRGYRFTAK